MIFKLFLTSMVFMVIFAVLAKSLEKTPGYMTIKKVAFIMVGITMIVAPILALLVIWV